MGVESMQRDLSECVRYDLLLYVNVSRVPLLVARSPQRVARSPQAFYELRPNIMMKKVFQYILSAFELKQVKCVFLVVVISPLGCLHTDTDMYVNMLTRKYTHTDVARRRQSQLVQKELMSCKFIRFSREVLVCAFDITTM